MERLTAGTDEACLHIFRISATGAYPVSVERLVLFFNPIAKGMLCPGYLGAASQTDLDLFAVKLVFIAPVAEYMLALAAFPVVTSCTFLALDAGMLICIMPL